LRALVQSEGQRGSGELEVFDLGLRPEHGRVCRLGLTPVAGRWSSGSGYPPGEWWREMRESGEDLGRILHAMARVPSLSLLI
jgi:hypothetical protein